MTKTKIALWSAGGVLSAVGTFFAGYFTGKSMERKRMANAAVDFDKTTETKETTTRHQHASA